VYWTISTSITTGTFFGDRIADITAANTVITWTLILTSELFDCIVLITDLTIMRDAFRIAVVCEGLKFSVYFSHNGM
jgi:hypothetical protein